MTEIIAADRSLIPALDLRSVRDLPDVLTAVQEVPFVKAVKPGFTLGLDNLKETRQIIREYKPDWKAIYDHQKAGCDIPRNGENFAYKMVEAGIDAAIIFPLGGAETEVAWIKALQDAMVPVIVGAEMTQEGFFVSEGGFIADEAPERMFRIAAGMGVRHFFLPGNKPEKILYYRELITQFTEGEDFTVYSCGYFKQGGDPAKATKVAGRRSHYVVGDTIVKAGGIAEMKAAALRASAEFQEAA